MKCWKNSGGEGRRDMSRMNFSIQEGDSQLENSPVAYSLISPSLMSACGFFFFFPPKRYSCCAISNSILNEGYQ